MTLGPRTTTLGPPPRPLSIGQGHWRNTRPSVAPEWVVAFPKTQEDTVLRACAVSGSMKRLTNPLCLIFTLFLFSTTSAWSADFDKGLAAAQKGDF